jgi:hypothetical protein
MPDPIRPDEHSHDEAEDLLPWYVTGQLEPSERALVEHHLASCAHCQRQLAFERRLVDEFQALTPEIDTGWARLRQRLEPRERWRDRAGREAAAVWQLLSRPPVAVLAAAQLAFVIFAAGLLLTLSRPSYHALGSSSAPAAANVIVMFRPDTTEAEWRGVLRASGASLVGGPTSTDAYLLAVPATSRPVALNTLRADDHVVMAEAIDGGRP